MIESVDNQKAKFNARLLAFCQAMVAINQSATMATGGIIGTIIAPQAWLATLPITTFILGIALTSYPASKLMGRIGRRNGFMIGGAIGIMGNLIAALAIYHGHFYLFCVGTLLTGSYGGFGQLYRFAAADIASNDMKPKVMSWVLIGGIIGAIGPEIVNFTTNYTIGVTYVSTFIAIASTAVIAIAALSFLSIHNKEEQQAIKEEGRSVLEFLRTPKFLIAAFAGAAGYALMNLVMTAAPIAMLASHHPEEMAFRGIALHIFSMFAPSLFTGKWIAKYGAERITILGFLLLIFCAIIGLTGITIIHFWIVLILLGIGWNFSFLGASALITQIHTNQEKETAQGLNDAIVMSTVVLGSISAGILLNFLGWNAVLGLVVPISLIGILLVVLFTKKYIS